MVSFSVAPLVSTVPVVFGSTDRAWLDCMRYIPVRGFLMRCANELFVYYFLIKETNYYLFFPDAFKAISVFFEKA